MDLVYKMNKSEWKHQYADFECMYRSQDELAKNGTKEQLLQLLSQFLSTPEGKQAASQTVGIKTFKDMYTKKQRSSQAD